MVLAKYKDYADLVFRAMRGQPGESEIRHYFSRALQGDGLSIAHNIAEILLIDNEEKQELLEARPEGRMALISELLGREIARLANYLKKGLVVE